VSRIGRLPVPVPQEVSVRQDGNMLMIKGPRGELSRRFHPSMSIALADGALLVSRPDDSRQSKALHGLTRALVANMVVGVTQGFRKRLVINGVGYRAVQQGEAIVLQVGYSHPVTVTPPPGISITVERGGRSVVVEGNDKEAVGELAARTRAVRKPEPYKGKGIAYDGEVIRRKAGKAGRIGEV
jgi:large subunit ribosomal protein L6